MKRICSEVDEAREFLYKHKSENKVRDYITFLTKKYCLHSLDFVFLKVLRQHFILV
jgi:hypothetical protein